MAAVRQKKYFVFECGLEKETILTPTPPQSIREGFFAHIPTCGARRCFCSDGIDCFHLIWRTVFIPTDSVQGIGGGVVNRW